ncbi:hypothetical protein PHYSODRAFT_390062, partial [Phytophthora sojae]
MDHYAGKLVVHGLRSYFQLNAAALRPIWNSDHIRDIHIEMTEKATLQNRVHYFDSAGIIRDVMVNHLQLLLNIAPPLVVGQYDEFATHYQDEMGRSLDESGHFTPTAAMVELRSSLQTWSNSTFRLAAAKATEKRVLTVVITFTQETFPAGNSAPCRLTVTIQQGHNADTRHSHRIEWSCDVSNVLSPLNLPENWEYSDTHDHRVITPTKPNLQTVKASSWDLGDELSA